MGDNRAHFRYRTYDCRRFHNSRSIGQLLAVEGESKYDLLATAANSIGLRLCEGIITYRFSGNSGAYANSEIDHRLVLNRLEKLLRAHADRGDKVIVLK